MDKAFGILIFIIMGIIIFMVAIQDKGIDIADCDRWKNITREVPVGYDLMALNGSETLYFHMDIENSNKCLFLSKDTAVFVQSPYPISIVKTYYENQTCMRYIACGSMLG